MFNAPRKGGGLAQSAFLNSSGASPYVDPLASSTPNPSSNAFGDVDPWSTAPSPAIGTPQRAVDSGDEASRPPTISPSAPKDALSALIADPPPLYLSLHDQLELSMSGEVSLSSVQRLLSSSKLPAATVERIINLTSRDKSSLTRQEFFCALALVALAQSSPGEDISIETLSNQIPNLPLPNLSIPSTFSSASRSEYPATSPAPYTPSLSPWDTAPRQNGHRDVSGFSVASSVAQDGLNQEIEAERGYWKRLEIVEVNLIPEKEGWFLQKYTVESDKRASGPVSRRYSDFVWLLDCLSKRYPFRLLPALPPKRLGPDSSFLEQRRKALRRFINTVVNHPVIKDDGALNVFLTEPNFEVWRKRTKVSLDEESASKKLNPAQEMAIPSDLDEKLGVLRDHLPSLLASYQKLVVLAERSLARLQAANADASRIALSLQTIGEEVPLCCHRSVGGGQTCSLCAGIGRGLGEIGETWTRAAEEGEKRSTAILLGSIEALKTQRDLYVAFRDLFSRHDKLSKDGVEALRKKVEGRHKKMETLKSAQKPGWGVEVEKLVSANDLDNSNINSLLSRRVFIRACMWHELAVVFHSRQSAQATLGWRQFAKQEGVAAKALGSLWDSLDERLNSMPVD